MKVSGKIEDVTYIVGRGPTATFRLDGPAPALGAIITRARDGATWRLDGIERLSLRPLEPGDAVGFLLNKNKPGEEDPFARGEVIEWEVPDTSLSAPYVTWDAGVHAVYLRLVTLWPDPISIYQEEVGNVVVDLTRNGGRVLGVEMLQRPDVRSITPFMHRIVDAQVWLLAGLAWERAQPMLKWMEKDRFGAFQL